MYMYYCIYQYWYIPSVFFTLTLWVAVLSESIIPQSAGCWLWSSSAKNPAVIMQVLFSAVSHENNSLQKQSPVRERSLSQEFICDSCRIPTTCLYAAALLRTCRRKRPQTQRWASSRSFGSSWSGETVIVQIHARTQDTTEHEGTTWSCTSRRNRPTNENPRQKTGFDRDWPGPLCFSFWCWTRASISRWQPLRSCFTVLSEEKGMDGGGREGVLLPFLDCLLLPFVFKLKRRRSPAPSFFFHVRKPSCSVVSQDEQR